MFSPKHTRGRALRASFLIAACSVAGMAGLAHAQGSTQDSVSQQLQFVKALKAVYSSQSSTSGATAAAATINANAASSPACDNLMKAKQAAAENDIKNKLPPDPTAVIRNTTCFVDVMNVSIPMTGISFLDYVVGQLGPFIEQQACNSTSSWWNDMKTKVSAGEYQSLSNMGFQLANGQNPVAFNPASTGSNLISNIVAMPKGQEIISGVQAAAIGGNGSGTTTGGNGSGTTTTQTSGAAAETAWQASHYMDAISKLRAELGL